MKKYTYEVLKCIIEAFIEYQLEHSFNRREWVENGAGFRLVDYKSHYHIDIIFAVEKEVKGEAPNEEVVYKNRELVHSVSKDEPINILEVLNKVDTMLEEATKPYFN